MRVSYSEAIEILLNSKENKKGKFQFPIEEWGADLQSEHERYLVEKHFESPVVLFDYPKEIKAFYMRLNEDGKTVAAWMCFSQELEKLLVVRKEKNV
jgi:asparaginyl-tRNA synthetase